ncbi:MAG: branched-chain amino acid ABC transporter permease [Deltaproteobacteria bacterium]|nr:branched-chain amino acid ABC transporter permease [Deltaproteobacteria bacterium]
MTVETLLAQALKALVSGLTMGMVFGLVALGLTIIFGVMDIVNFAHGEFLMIGMYCGLLTYSGLGADPLFGLPIAAVVGFALGVGCYYGLVQFLLRGPMIAQLFGTFGLMLFLRNLALLIMGADPRGVHHGALVGKSFVMGPGIVVELTKLTAGIFSLLAFAAVWWLMNRTRIGLALTATALDGQAARYMGIPTEKMNAFAWGLGGTTVAVAGALLVNFWPVDPNVGLLFTMIAFTTVALGGFGSIPGAAFAGLIVGLLINLPPIWDAISAFSQWPILTAGEMHQFKYSFVYLAFFLIMVLRPRGLFGWKY